MTTPTSERLAAALKEAGAPDALVGMAQMGRFDAFKSTLAYPNRQLVRSCERYGLTDIAERAKQGEFDASDEEGEAWAKSPEGQATLRQLIDPDPPPGRGLKLSRGTRK